MYDVSNIKNYILYLKKECNLNISLHEKNSDKIIMPSELLSFNIHDNSYCIFVKTNKKAWDHCIDTQKKCVEKCKDGTFCGVCHAGVKEYVYPIKERDKVIGFISVSGYKCDNYREYITAISEKYSFSKEDLLLFYEKLKDSMPPKDQVDTLIHPLCDMLELAYIKTESEVICNNAFCDEVIKYLRQNHTYNIKSEDICKAISCSRSKLSHEFNKYMGMGIRDYINLLRMEDAKSLLFSSELSITEIALSLGYTDSVYFTNVFRKFTGQTPTEYRKSRH